MAEKQSIKKVSKDELVKGIYAATFTNGKEVRFDFGALYTGFNELPDVAKQGICYGFKQKLDDSMAGAADVDEAIEELESTVEALGKGKWTLRVAGEGAGEASGIFVKAFAQSRNISLADAKGQLAAIVEKNQTKNPGASERQLVAAIKTALMQQDTAFAAKYNELQAERAAKAKSKLAVEL